MGTEAFFHATEPSASAGSSQHDCVRPQHQRDNFVSIPSRGGGSGGRRVTVALRGFKRDVTPALPTTAKTPLRPAQRRSQKSFSTQLLLEEMSTPYAYLEINLVLGFGYGMDRKPLPVFGCNVLSYYLSVSVLPYSCRTSVKRRLANPRTPIAYCLASSRSDTLCRTALEIACVKPIARLRQPSVSLL